MSDIYVFKPSSGRNYEGKLVRRDGYVARGEGGFALLKREKRKNHIHEEIYLRKKRKCNEFKKYSRVR